MLDFGIDISHKLEGNSHNTHLETTLAKTTAVISWGVKLSYTRGPGTNLYQNLFGKPCFLDAVKTHYSHNNTKQLFQNIF